MKRLSAALRAFFLMIFLGVQILTPIKAYAFFLPFMVAAGGGGAAVEGLGVGAAVTGLVIAGFTALGGGDSKRQGQVAMTPGGVVLPSGWTVASDGTVAPPTSSGMVNVYRFGTTSTLLSASYTSQQAAINDGGAKYCASYSQAFVSATPNGINGTHGYTIKCTTQQSTNGYLDWNPGCGSGYTVSGSTCVLSNASAVSKPATASDGSTLPCQIIRTGNTFSFDGSNGACPTGADAQIVSPDGTVMKVIDGQLNVVPAYNAQPMDAELAKSRPAVSSAANASGGTVLKQTYTFTGTDGQQYTTTVSTEIGADGKVKGQSQVTNAGSGSLAQPGSVAAPQKLTVTCTDVGTCDVAKDGTLQGVKTGVEQVRDKLTVQGTTPNTTHDPLYSKGTKTLTSVWNGFKSSLASTAIVTFVTGFFNVSVGGGSCPTWSTAIGMGLPDFVVNHLCTPMADNMFLVVKGVLLVLAGWYAFRVAIDN